MMFSGSIPSPIGILTVAVDGDGAVRRLHFGRVTLAEAIEDEEAVAPLRKQLAEYFAGERRVFDLELKPDGTAFQRAVWQGLMTIPFGQIISYAELAERAGYPGAFRAVGAANGANPIAVIMPCHRVIGSDGRLTGFGGGIPTKAKLLAHEGAISPDLIAKADRRTRVMARAEAQSALF
jgi:methylated-DNA-[protein]-cysteine S-methyltransferase